MKNPFVRWGRWALMWSLATAALVTQAETQVSIGVNIPGVSIGIHTPQYPQFVRVPSYPVYYAPQQAANLFFYDGLYWAYQRDNWYSSAWYYGPWQTVGRQRVPLYVLRIPVRYYRDPPSYFRGWRPDAPPRWGEHWGSEWQQQRSGWDQWNRNAMPPPAPLPSYQRRYSGQQYPQLEQQQDLHGRNYRYQPRDDMREPPPPARARGNEGRPPGRSDDYDKHRQAGPGPGHNQGHNQGNHQGNGKAKGHDKDRDDADPPGQQRKK